MHNMEFSGSILNRKKEKKKKELNKKKNLREQGKDRSLCCIIWQGTSPVLSDGGVRMISLTNTHTHTQPVSLSLCASLSPCLFPEQGPAARADRIGPLGSCYRPPQRRDWKVLIAALRSPQSRENQSASVTGSLTWDRGKERADRKGEWKQVGHLVGVKEGKHAEGKAERERRRLSTRCSPEETVADIRNGTWAFPKPKVILSDRQDSHLPTQSIRILCISLRHKLKVLI